jgi:AraC-like DNA-binding protein
MQHIRTEHYSIHPTLRSLIRHIVIIDADLGDEPITMEGHFMPSPYQAMFINLHTRFKSKKLGKNNFEIVTPCTLMGPQITPFKLSVGENHKAVSIIFQPGALNRFLNIPMSEIFDNGYSAREVIGREIEELVDKSYDTQSSKALNAVVQSYFLKKCFKMNESLPIDVALQYLLVHHNTNIDKIADMACMSIRTFERKCKERLGMPAKMYARIAKFHKAYQILEHKPSIAWSDLVHHVGYYDQSHFIKDFKEFAKVNPTFIHKEFSAEHWHIQLDWDSM